MREPIFKIGDIVYYITPESVQGVVTDISYSYLSGLHKYLIGISFSENEWCTEAELSDTKRF